LGSGNLHNRHAASLSIPRNQGLDRERQAVLGGLRAMDQQADRKITWVSLEDKAYRLRRHLIPVDATRAVTRLVYEYDDANGTPMSP